ncbi:twin-arginine translocation signal domain-containing protein [Streptomyces sp. NBC_01187]|uniref:twin-arginine translocation signal domain-containing protein n=1 Tax=Streptomyces sp. NBC_01187 TaxID=2903766 RepID=UPI00386C3D02|nr:twin-arginine translocation signal domain-containing protein [Streptomyces sp. NBC_01187]
MSIDRRSLLKGTAAAGAALPLGALAAGHAEAAPSYQIAVLDVNRNNVCIFNRGDQFTDANIKWSFNPGWGDVLETRFRDTTNDGSVFMVAGGGSLHLYAPTNGSISSLKYLRSYPFHQAHGVLWGPAYNLLWAVGGTVLRSYRVEGTYQEIKLVQAGQWAIAGNGHDVQPDYTDQNVLYVTDSGHVYKVDKRNPAAMEVSSTRKYVLTRGRATSV